MVILLRLDRHGKRRLPNNRIEGRLDATQTRKYIMKTKKLFIAAALTLAACAQYETIQRAPVSRAEIAEIQRVTRAGLKDPDAAQFKNIQRINATFTDDTKQTYICGEVNGKNSFGAYTGFRVFKGRFIGDRFALDVIADRDTDAVYRYGCGL